MSFGVKVIEMMIITGGHDYDQLIMKALEGGGV